MRGLAIGLWAVACVLILGAVLLLAGCGGDDRPAGTASFADLRSGAPVLLPVPKQVAWSAAGFAVSAATDIVSYSEGGVVGRQAVRRVQTALAEAGLGTPRARIGVRFGTGPDHIILRPPTAAEAAAHPQLSGPESYLLIVAPYRVNIVATTPRGLFCGAQTLTQMIGGATIPGCRIVDWPTESFRAFHFTVNPDMYRDPRIYPVLIEAAGRLKYNTVIVQFQSTIELARHPEAVRAQGVVSQAEVRRWVARARSYGMEIFPEVKSWGHADWTWGLGNVFYDHDTAPNFPLYSPMFALPPGRDGQNSFCPTEPKVYRLLSDTYTELLDVFGQPKYLHIGGDEAWAAGYQQGVLTGDPVEDGTAWVKRLAGFLRGRGVTTIMWGDMFLEASRWLDSAGPGCNSRADLPTHKILKRLPKDIIIADWHYRVKPDYASLQYFRNEGFSAVGACYGFYGFDNIINFNRRAVRSGALGMIQTSWKLLHTDTGFLPFGAESMWNGGQRTVGELPVDLNLWGHGLLDPLLYAGWQADCLDFRGGRPVYPPFTAAAGMSEGADDFER